MSSGFGGSGFSEVGNVLSFGGTVSSQPVALDRLAEPAHAQIAGFALGWTSLAADYTVNFPADSKKWKVFLYTYLGLKYAWNTAPETLTPTDDTALQLPPRLLRSHRSRHDEHLR